MRVKLLLHGVCLTAIVALTGWAVREKMGNDDSTLLAELRFAFENSLPELEYAQKRVLAGIADDAKQYPSQKSEEILAQSELAATETDSLLALLDSLEKNLSETGVIEAQGRVVAFRSKMLELVENDPSVAFSMPDFSPTDWLFQSFKNDAPEKFAVVLAETKVKLRLIGLQALHYRAAKVGTTIICTGPEIIMNFNQLSARVGEEVEADICFNWGPSQMYSRDIVFRLDGKKLPEKNGLATFQVRFDKPGRYPLRFTAERVNWRTDSTEVWGKTYFLDVRE